MEDKLKVEINKFESNKTTYLEKYEGKYIALIDGEVVDFDENFSILAKRVFTKYDYRPIYMPLVTKEKRKIRIATPKFKLKK